MLTEVDLINFRKQVMMLVLKLRCITTPSVSTTHVTSSTTSSAAIAAPKTVVTKTPTPVPTSAAAGFGGVKKVIAAPKITFVGE